MTATKTNPRTTTASRRLSGGMTLIELLVALAIGSFLLLGAVTVFLQGQTTFRINESVARLQENARFVLNTVEPDIRMAHFFGLTTRSGKITNRASQTVADTGVGPSECGANWAIDLDLAVEGSNGAANFPFPTATCDAFGNPQGDTLTIRRVEEDPVTAPAAPLPNWMYIQSWRLQPGEIFTGPTPPSSAPGDAIHRLVVHGYYVSDDSTLSTPGNAVPSLRVKMLAGGSLGPTVREQEVLPGVEDMQVQFGVDTDLDGEAGRGVIDRFVDPDAAIITQGAAGFLPDAEILAVRIWLRMRAELPEIGYENTNTYTYAGVNFDPNPDDSYRRLVVSKTIYLRNARPAS